MSKKSRPEKKANPTPLEEASELDWGESDHPRTDFVETPTRRDWVAVILRVSAVVVLIGALLVIFRHLLLIEKHFDRQKQGEVEHAFWQITRKGTQAEDRTTAFKRLVAAGNNEWRIANLKYLELENVDLRELEFKEAGFESCNFKKADLYKSNFLKCRFEMCNLTQANLELADLSESRLFKADLSKANMKHIILRKADLAQTTIKDADLQHSDLSEADLEMADLSKSNLGDANLTNATLRNANLSGTNLAHAIMPTRFEAYVGTDFTGSNWWRARGLPFIVDQRCRQDFAPTKSKSPKKLYEDYQLWLKTTGSNNASP